MCCFFKRAAKTHCDEVISYHLNTSKAFNEFVHFSLEHLWSRGDSERHALPSITAKWRLEGREVG